MPDPSTPPVASAPVDAVDSGPVAPGRGSGPGGRWTGRFAPLRVLVALIVVAAVATGWLLIRPTGPAYRTATAASGTAVASLSAVGTITPVQQADLTFAASGTVGTVDVTVGQHVTAGQVVATLDPTSLQSAVVAADAELASAQATLAADETTQVDGTATTTSTNSSTGSGTGTGGGGAPSSSASAGGTVAASANPAVAKLQATLVADQHQEDAAASAAGSALQTATTVCTAGSTASAVGGQAPASPGPPPGGSGGGGQMTCSQALAAASTAHQALVTAIDKVTKDEAALASALGLGGSGGSGGSGGAGAGSPGPGGTPTTTSTTHPATVTTTTVPGGSGTGSTTATTSRSASAGSSSTTTSRTRTVTPELIALDQANVDVAQAALTGAQRAAGQANLVSTIAGTVGSVALAAGQTVGAGSPSSTPQVVVVGSGSDYEVTTTVPVTKIQLVAVGQQALVTPDSSSTVLTGTVSGIGVLGTSTTTSTTYPVTIAFQSPDLGPFSGAESSVQIVTSRASDVTTVPSSAVRTVGINHLVTVVEGGTATSVRVTVGTVGTVRTQILSGVHVGETVSLASVDAPVPSSSTTTRGGLAGLAGGGGLGGAGGLGAGGAGAGGFSRVARG